MDGRSGDVLLSLGTFGACWMLGFAHHDGSLRRIPARTVVAGGWRSWASDWRTP